MLEPNLRRPRRRLGKRIALAAAFAGSGVTAALAISIVFSGLVPAEREVAILVPMQPIVIERQVAMPTPAPPSPAPKPAGLACPVLDDAGEVAVGEAVVIDDVVRPYTDDDSGPLEVVAAAGAPKLAVRVQDEAYASDDDGAKFRRVFRDHAVEQVAMAPDGTLYAVSGNELGTRIDGKERWRAFAACPSETCRERIAVVGDKLAWQRDTVLSVSPDRGRTWKGLADPWADDGVFYSWRGSLYQISHYVDRCGVDDSPVFKLSPSNTIANTIFHNYYVEDEHVLRASDDAGTSWTWRERCGNGDSKMRACRDRDADVSEMLRAKTLLPVEGARALAVYEHGLVELCEDGARLLYRTFPFERVDAVDQRGRPIVTRERSLYRWSAKHGWRRLWTAPPVPPGEE